MYNDISGPSLLATSGGMLASTGTSVFWLFLATFALIAAGTALWRIVPRRRKEF